MSTEYFRISSTLPPINANVSAAMMLLTEIRVATRPTVQWAWPPKRTGHVAPIPAEHKVHLIGRKKIIIIYI